MDIPFLHPTGTRNRLVVILTVIWPVLIAASLSWNWFQMGKSSTELALREARSNFNKDILYRRWAAMQGGVYVPPTDKTPPNPYLADLPDRDVTTTSGQKLTLINPAYMTRQVHELGLQESGIRGHITSIRPIRPGNAADAWEKEALHAFAKGAKEIHSIQMIDGRPYMRLMHPLVTEKACLRCHATQGYKEGDIRGGISVSVPFEPFADAAGKGQFGLAVGHILIGLLGLFGLWGGNRLLGRSEQELRKSELLWRLSRDNMLEAYALHEAIFDENGRMVDYRFLEFNPAAQKMADIARDKIVGRTAMELYPHIVERGLMDRYADVMATGVPAVIDDFYYSGDNLDKAFDISCFRIDRRHFVCLFRDITERIRTEEELRDTASRLRLATTSAKAGVWDWHLQTKEMIWDDRMLELYGLTRDNFPGGVEAWEQGLHPDDSSQAIEECEAALRGERVFDTEFRVNRPNGTVVHIKANGLVLRDEGGKAVRMIGLNTDITNHKMTEEERRSLQERLQRSEKMEALGQLAGGVAHDLNNVLGVSTVYSELLREQTPQGSPLRRYVDGIFSSNEKAAAIIQDLLTLARRGVAVSEVMNLNAVVASLFGTPEFEKIRSFHPDVTFSRNCDEELMNIKGSPVHIEKTLINLISNAAEAFSSEGDVTIKTENRYLDMPIRGYDEVKQGDYVVLTVSDTGMGIPADDREKIFEPFYTKKTMGRSGTGLGLSIVWGTVKDHRGYIDLQSEVGKGTTFTLYFPATREEMAASRQKVPMERYMGKGESVLVVDDIVEQREVAINLLSRLGYQVHAVSGGEEAVEYLKRKKADILVLDMIMAPGIDGLETYKRVLEISPEQKAILVSGFSETDRVSEAQERGAGAYVKKPYVIEKIGVAIRDELQKILKGV